MNNRSLPKIILVILLVFTVSTAQMSRVSGKPHFRYVEFNEERKWPGQTHIVPHGIMLKIIAALKEPNKQSMKADLILIDENDDARVERMTRINTDGINEWHEYDLDTNTLNPGPYTLRIKAWNSAREDTSEHGGVESVEVTWGDLYLSLQIQSTQTTQQPAIPGFPWEGIILGLAGAVFVIISNRRPMITPSKRIH